MSTFRKPVSQSINYIGLAGNDGTVCFPSAYLSLKNCYVRIFLHSYNVSRIKTMKNCNFLFYGIVKNFVMRKKTDLTLQRTILFHIYI